MSAPDPESYGLLGKLIAAGSAIVLPVLGVKAWADKQLEKKADKEATEKATANCLRHIEELYKNAEDDRAATRVLHDRAMDQLRENEQRAQDRYERLMERLSK